jgi:hypothetical protein
MWQNADHGSRGKSRRQALLFAREGAPMVLVDQMADRVYACGLSSTSCASSALSWAASS